MRKHSALPMLLAILLILGAPIARAVALGDDDDDDEGEENPAAVIKALPDAKVSLEQALVACEAVGKPVSAKFEVGDGKLQLSVYTMKGNAFSEVIVDHATGKDTKTEAITGGADLTAAKSQSEAI